MKYLILILLGALLLWLAYILIANRRKSRCDNSDSGSSSGDSSGSSHCDSDGSCGGGDGGGGGD